MNLKLQSLSKIRTRPGGVDHFEGTLHRSEKRGLLFLTFLSLMAGTGCARFSSSHWSSAGEPPLDISAIHIVPASPRVAFDYVTPMPPGEAASQFSKAVLSTSEPPGAVFALPIIIAMGSPLAALRGVPDPERAQAERAITNAFGTLDPVATVSQAMLSAGARRLSCPWTLEQAMNGTPGRQFKDGSELWLKITSLTIALEPQAEADYYINPKLALTLSVSVSILRDDGHLLYFNSWTEKGKRLKFVDWAARDRTSIMDELNWCSVKLANRAVAEMFAARTP